MLWTSRFSALGLSVSVCQAAGGEGLAWKVSRTLCFSVLRLARGWPKQQAVFPPNSLASNKPVFWKGQAGLQADPARDETE